MQCTKRKNGRKLRDCFCLHFFQANWANFFDLLRFVAGNETTPSFGALPEIEDGMEEVKEPEKVVKMKSKEQATAPATEEDLSGLVNKWGTKKK